VVCFTGHAAVPIPVHVAALRYKDVRFLTLRRGIRSFWRSYVFDRKAHSFGREATNLADTNEQS
jgi:hypothetical protein